MKNRLIDKLIFFNLIIGCCLIALFISCDSKIEHTFFYDDNVTQITDSLQLKFLTDEITELFDSSQLEQSLRIETSICKKYKKVPKKVSSLFQNSRNELMLESIENGNELNAILNEPDDVLQTHVIVLKNKTGEIIINNGELSRSDFHTQVPIYSKIYGYLYLLNKGASPLDTFRFRDPSSIGNWSSEAWDGPLYEGFGYTNPEGQPKCPYLGIKRIEWERFMCKLRIKDYDLVYFDNPENEIKPLIITSTLDYLKIVSMIQSQVGQREPSSISKISNESGNCLYKRKKSIKIFDNKVLKKFKSLLDLGTNRKYYFLRIKNGIQEDCHLNNAMFNDQLTTIYSNQTYTIVLIARINGKYKYGKYRLFIRRFEANKYIQIVLASLGHKQIEGKCNKMVFEKESGISSSTIPFP